MTSFTSLSITALVCNAASKLNWTVRKNSTCDHITTETVNCKIVHKTLQWFQNKRTSHWRYSIKEGVLKKSCNIHRKTPAPEPPFNKVAGHTFSTEPLPATASGINVPAKIWNKIVQFEDLRILVSLCNFNFLQIFVKVKFTVVKFNSKISIIYHQIKFRKGLMNRSSIKMLLLKVSQ